MLHFRRVHSAILFVFVVFAVSLPAFAAPPSQTVWLVSSRSIEASCSQQTGTLEYWQLGGDCQWNASDEKAFLAADSATVPTVFFLHGNRTGSERAVALGMHVQTLLKDQADGKPFRMVIWSWPSDRIPGRNRLDAQVKAVRSDREGFYLASLVAKMRSDVPISMIGFSFGARSIGGALQLLAGGEFDGQKLPPLSTPARKPIRAALIAAAMDDFAFATDLQNGQAGGQVERMLVTCNPVDCVLRWYRLMYRGGGPDALGFTGAACANLSGEKLEQVNVSCEVGHEHSWQRYFCAPSVRSRLGWYAFVK
jgi:hypothetical protein